MINKQQQLIVNLNEYVSFEQKLNAVLTIMELLDLEFDSDKIGQEQVIKIKRHNEDMLHLVMEEFDRLYRK